MKCLLALWLVLLFSPLPAPAANRTQLTLQPQESQEATFTPNGLVQNFLNYYSGPGRNKMAMGLVRSGLFTSMARRIFNEEGVPQDLVSIAQVLSGWNPKTTIGLKENKVGIWQL